MPEEITSTTTQDLLTSQPTETSSSDLDTGTTVATDRTALIESSRGDGLIPGIETAEDFEFTNQNPATLDTTPLIDDNLQQMLRDGHYAEFVRQAISGEVTPETALATIQEQVMEFLNGGDQSGSLGADENKIRAMLLGLSNAIHAQVPDTQGEQIVHTLLMQTSGVFDEQLFARVTNDTLNAALAVGGEDMADIRRAVSTYIESQVGSLNETTQGRATRAAVEIAVERMLRSGAARGDLFDAARQASRLAGRFDQDGTIQETVIRVAEELFRNPQGNEQELRQMAIHLGELCDRFDLEQRYVGRGVSAEQMQRIELVRQGIDRAIEHGPAVPTPEREEWKLGIAQIVVGSSSDIEGIRDRLETHIEAEVRSLPASEREAAMKQYGAYAVQLMLRKTTSDWDFKETVEEAASLANNLGISSEVVGAVLEFAKERYGSTTQDEAAVRTMAKQLGLIRKEFELEAGDVGENLSVAQAAEFDALQARLGVYSRPDSPEQRLIDAHLKIEGLLFAGSAERIQLGQRSRAIARLIEEELQTVPEGAERESHRQILGAYAVGQMLGRDFPGVSFGHRVQETQALIESLGLQGKLNDQLLTYAAERFQGKGTQAEVRRQASELGYFASSFGLRGAEVGAIARRLDEALQNQPFDMDKAKDELTQIMRIEGLSIGGKVDQLRRTIEQSTAGMSATERAQKRSELAAHAVGEILTSAPEQAEQFSKALSEAHDLSSYFSAGAFSSESVAQALRERYEKVDPDTPREEILQKGQNLTATARRFGLPQEHFQEPFVRINTAYQNWFGPVNLRKARQEITDILESQDDRYSDLDDRQGAIEDVINRYARSLEQASDRQRLRERLGAHALAGMLFHREPGKAIDMEDNFDQMEDLVDNLDIEHAGTNTAMNLMIDYVKLRLQTADSIQAASLLEQFQEFRDEFDVESDQATRRNQHMIEYMNQVEAELRKKATGGQ